MNTFRLLQTGYNTAAFNMALDEVLINRIASGQSAPTLRFYRWQPSTISIGYFQSMEAEVDLNKCRELGVDVVRRQTGGGAVFHDDEVTYSMHVPLSLRILPEKILDSYAKICGALITGLKQININAHFAPLNDIVVGDTVMQKISGNAQTRKQGVLLQHGTILKSVNVEKMFDLLKVPDEKLKGKLITDIKQRVTSIDDYLGHSISFDKIVEALISGFKQDFSEVQFVEDSLTDAEIADATALAEQKYNTNSWNYQR